ncbi:HNH endonuclease [Desulforegula conservatrix]|uniref:HNH endonuclease n=1 Tax=Desulforegula conservatrix TaxID=153026 RepID=UPI00040AF609|nr:hypothetical protein [Desulforegula conservatrix]
MRISDEARGYYWGVVVEWWAWFWDSGRITKAEMHEILKDYSGIESIASGEISEKDFINHIERCCDLFTRISGGAIPPPERYRYLNVFAPLDSYAVTNSGVAYSGSRKPDIFYLEGQAWTTQVIRMKDRDGNRCCVCGARSNLTPHHIKSKGGLEGGGDELGNLMTLCIGCHSKCHDHRFNEHEYLLFLSAARKISRLYRQSTEISKPGHINEVING